jgi:hypothetical protein
VVVSLVSFLTFFQNLKVDKIGSRSGRDLQNFLSKFLIFCVTVALKMSKQLKLFPERRKYFFEFDLWIVCKLFPKMAITCTFLLILPHSEEAPTRKMRPGQPGPRQPEPPGQPEAPGQPQQNGPRQPGPSQRRDRRDLRRRLVPLPETANPMAKDFSAPHGGVYGVHLAKRWMQTFEVVRRRPEFRPIAIHTLSKARNGNKQILSVQFGNFILEGTWPRIMEVLFIKIIQATENSFEGDTAAQMAASNAAQMAASNAAQHYMHYMWVGSNAAQIAASNAAEMDAAEMDAAENAAVMAAINAAEKAIAGQMARMADSNDSQELI